MVYLLRGCGWGGGGVGSGAGPGEVAEAGPFGELGQEVAGLDLELRGEFCAAPGAAGIGAHDRRDAVPAGFQRGRAGCAPVAPGPDVDGRGADGDVDRGD